MEDNVTKFRVEWEDCETGEKHKEIVEFADWTGHATLEGKKVGPLLTITAKEWAEDYAYAVADKGPYTVVKL